MYFVWWCWLLACSHYLISVIDRHQRVNTQSRHYRRLCEEIDELCPANTKTTCHAPSCNNGDTTSKNTSMVSHEHTYRLQAKSRQSEQWTQTRLWWTIKRSVLKHSEQLWHPTVIYNDDVHLKMKDVKKYWRSVHGAVLLAVCGWSL